MKIETNQIYCIIPFYAAEGAIGVGGTLWKKQAPKIEEDAFYDFIKVGANTPDVYAPDFGSKVNAPLHRFFERTFTAAIGRGNPRRMRVKLLNEGAKSWRGPRLIVSRSGHVGLLSIALELPEAADVADIVGFNYAFHKYDSGQMPVLTAEGHFDAALGLNHEDAPDTWTLAALVRLLTADCGACRMFTPMRAHMLTYLLGSDTPLPLNTNVEDAMLRLMHCHDEKYTPVPGAFASGCVMRTFANIYTGACAEGACVLGVLKGDGSDGFMRNYPNANFQTRFLWLYFTALLRRHTLLDTDRRLAAADVDSIQADALARLNVADVCASRLSGSFASVSTYSHINDIYSFLTRCFSIDALYAEISDKLQVVDTWLKLRDAERRERFERFVQVGGMVFAALALLYGIPQAITAISDTVKGGYYLLALLCVLPAIAGFIWILCLLRKRK